MAGVALHKLIIEETPAVTRDQDHLDLVHVSLASHVADRTGYLLGRDTDNPADGMVQALGPYLSAAADSGRQIVIGVPCNTFHVPSLFQRFRRGVEELVPAAEIVNMIELTAAVISRDFSQGPAGLLSTSGTLASGVYPQALQGRGPELLTLGSREQETLQRGIYHRRWGLKALSPPHERAVAAIESAAAALAAQGAESLIAGCTEIPLALPGPLWRGIPVINPARLLARELVAAALLPAD